MKIQRIPRLVLVPLAALALDSARVMAQTASPPATDTTSMAPAEDDTVILSPFVVDASEDKDNYQATSTLAGSRVRTDLKDIASSISVITTQFLKDTGATNNLTLLQYTTNTEVGGVYGNFGGIGNTFIDGANESNNLTRPNSNTRVRGLDSADNTRDYFLSDIPWDSYNTGRVDLQRGPNSILFGIGSPAGIINSSINTAGYKTEGSIENRVGSFGTVRTSLDYNYVIIPHQLAVRFSALDDNTKYREKPAYNWDRRLFGAVRWDPKLFGANSNAHTTVRINYEHGDIKSNNPRVLPPIDRITPFFDSDKINKQTFDPYYAWAAGIVPYSSSSTASGESKNFWLVQYPGPGISATNNPVLYYDNVSTPSTARQGGLYGYFGLKSDGTEDHAIDGFPFGSPVGIASYNEWAIDLSRVDSSNPLVPGAQSGFYKSKSLTDPSIFDFYNTLMDGTTKKEWQNWEAYNISLEQTFFNDKLGFQFVYDRQKYRNGHEANLGGSTYISVDILKDTTQYPWAYTAANGYSAPYQVVTNPNAGRAFTGSSAKNGMNGSMASDRESIRFTGTGELHADDILGHTTLASILGHHTITGLYSQDKYFVDSRNWVRYAVTGDWSSTIGHGYFPDANLGDGLGGVRSGDVVIDNVTYLSPSLLDSKYTSASGLHLPGIKADQSPTGSIPVTYYDSHWKWSLDPANPNYVDPNAAWTNPAVIPGNSNTSTQSENPANYVGWQTGTFSVLNADKGDLNRLYTDGSKVQTRTTSEGITWQAFLWDDTIVGTFGWRHDEQKQRSASGPQDATGVASMDYDLNPLDPTTGVSKGTSRSWGIVVHTPKALRDKLPLGTNVSLSLSDGANTRVENRYGFDGSVLPNATGHTRDYSVIVSTLNDKLTLKATYYKTQVKNADISSVTSEVSTLGNNTYYLRNLEAWGTGSALMDLGGFDKLSGYWDSWDWYWNWAEVDHGFDSAYKDPSTTLWANDPSTIKEKAAIASWLSQMQPQSWFDAYGFPIDVAKAQQGDYLHAIGNGSWTPPSYIGGIQPSGGGRINGSWPTGTVDNESKGWEFEIVGQPTKNWNVSINASKQFASQTALGADIVSFIEASETKYLSPAGDLRLWWGGDQTVRDYYNQNIWSAYQFQKQTNGKMVPEMSPWRFNLVTNYTFDRGALKGLNLGGGVRWQQGVILGYALNTTTQNLDVDKPYWGPNQHWIDLWAGYERKLTDKIKWRLQVNLRNVGDNAHLTPISVQPDGSPGAFRIEEGMTWTVTNTFSF